MAITVNIYYTGAEGKARAFAEEMTERKIVDDIRSEDGNLRYEYFFPMGSDTTVLLIDSWKDQQALDHHHASPMMKEIAVLREKYGLHMKVERYVSEAGGIPSADAKFIV